MRYPAQSVSQLYTSFLLQADGTSFATSVELHFLSAFREIDSCARAELAAERAGRPAGRPADRQAHDTREALGLVYSTSSFINIGCERQTRRETLTDPWF